MSRHDRADGDEARFIEAAAHLNFDDLARAHDKAISKAVEHFSANDRGGGGGGVGTSAGNGVGGGGGGVGTSAGNGVGELAKGMHHSRFADLIKAVMQFRFPEASDVWFNE